MIPRFSRTLRASPIWSSSCNIPINIVVSGQQPVVSSHHLATEPQATPTWLEGSRDVDRLVRLDAVADLDVVVTGELETAFQAAADFLDVFLETFEAVER